jgi:hypothetical protein
MVRPTGTSFGATTTRACKTARTCMVINFLVVVVLGIIVNVIFKVSVGFVLIVSIIHVIIVTAAASLSAIINVTVAVLIIFTALVTAIIVTLTLAVQTDTSPDLRVNLSLSWLVAAICDTVDFSCLCTDIPEIGLCFPNQNTVPCEHDITIFSFAEVKLRRCTRPLVILTLRYASRCSVLHCPFFCY